MPTPSLLRRGGVLTAFVCLLCMFQSRPALIGMAVAEPPADESEAPSLPEVERTPRGDRPGLDGRSRGRGRGPMTEGDMERLCAVVADISPEWASSLRARLAEDPESARADFRQHGRRLFGLVMLKERNPGLYTVRIAELALKRGMKERAIEYHRVLGVDAARADTLSSQLREMAAESVDLELRARAMELEALDQAVRELRERLLGEVAEREARIDSVWQDLLDNDPSREGEGDPLEGLRDRRRPPTGRPAGSPSPPGSDRS